MSESKPIVLRSAANPTIRRLAKMRGSNRARRKSNRILVDGWRETAQAIRAGLVLRGVYVPESALAEPAAGDAAVVREVLHAAGNQLTWVADSVIEKISFGQSVRGVVAEFDQPTRTLDDLRLPAAPLILVLDQVEKPGNIGAVFRSVDAAGIDAVVLCDSNDVFNPNAIRSSLGSVFHVPSADGTEAEVKHFLQSRGIRVLAARVESSEQLWAADLSGPLAIVLGSEAAGLAGRWQEIGGCPIAGVRIPMAGKVDSLNVSVSAAVIGFEAIRQRRDV